MRKTLNIKIFLITTLLILSTSCQSTRNPPRNYPAQWWSFVDPEGAPSWEILPQSARRKQSEVILSKRTSLGILSNFAHTPFELNGVLYQSLEGFWQMMKYPESKKDLRALDQEIQWEHTRSDVSQMIGFEAKRAGTKASGAMELLGINWVTYLGEQLPYRVSHKGAHYNLIYRATWAKVTQNDSVKKILLQTQGLKLLPDHHQKSNTPPAWKYYQILTEIREILLKDTP